MRVFFVLLVAVFFVQRTQSREFVYPVGVHSNDQNKVFIVYQKSPSNIELWIWDSYSKIVSRGLLSVFSPAYFRLLPGGDGFGFLDNDRIRIKHFNCRSPKSINLSKPIYNIGGLEWIDFESFIFSAKHRNCSKIFWADKEGEARCIASSIPSECMYPQKVEDQLFYVERDFDGTHRIVVGAYPEIKRVSHSPSSGYEEDFSRAMMMLDGASTIEPVEPIRQADRSIVLEAGQQSIAFLRMQNSGEGFFVEHPSIVDRTSETITLNYVHFFSSNNTWNSKTLFSFLIPTKFLLQVRGEEDSVLYESILPLLPTHEDNKIYFFTAMENLKNETSGGLFEYDLDKGEIKKVTANENSGKVCFGPLRIGKELFCGGELGFSDRASGGAPVLVMDEEGDEYLSLPRFQI